ncbi:MAG: sulfotransferase [Sedimentisphaerales bacterium]|nr:sulfotransferase [Sedimentisphaerales bacterium]
MINLAYILSASYSGSTLLTFLLGTHPKIGTIGELKATARGNVDQYYCSCGKLIHQCEFWQQVGKELAQKNVTFDITNFGTHFCCNSSRFADRLLRAAVRGTVFEKLRKVGLNFSPTARQQFKKILDKNKAVIDAVLKLQKATVFLDGSKDPIRLKYLSDSGYWNIKAIFLTRDGRGAANSYMKHHCVDMKTAAIEWKRCNEEAENILHGLNKSQWIEVRYEELCNNTENTLVRLFDFLGLDPSKRAQDFHSVENHILGNEMRMNTTSQIRLDEKWKSVLKDEELKIFDFEAGKMNRRYEYK